MMALQVQIGGDAREGPTWYRCGGDLAALTKLANPLGLHPLAVEDAHTSRQRPKLERYDDRLFLVIRLPREDQESMWQHLAIFAGPQHLVTASEQPVPELDSLAAEVHGKDVSIGQLLHQVVDRCVDSWFPFMDGVEDAVEALGERVLEVADPDGRMEIRQMKHLASRVRKVSLPMREAVLALERLDHPLILLDDRPFLRDVSDHMVRLHERLDHVRESIVTAQETWMATLAQSQNQNMQRLTVLFALFLVPGLLAGLGGMNFDGFPAWDYWWVTGILLGMVALGAAFARSKKWL